MTTAIDFSDLYCNYQASILAFIRRRVLKHGSSPELAEDLTQDVFRKAFEAIRGGTEVTQVSGWLFQIARNLVVDYYRARGRQAQTVHWDEVWDVPTESPTPHELAERAITYQRVRRAVSKLRGEQSVVIMRRLDGYEFTEIADELGKKYETVKALQHRGYENLQLWLRQAA